MVQHTITPAIGHSPLTQDCYVQDSLVNMLHNQNMQSKRGKGRMRQHVVQPGSQSRYGNQSALMCRQHYHASNIPYSIPPKYICTRACMPVRHGSQQQACLPCMRPNQQALRANTVPHYVKQAANNTPKKSLPHHWCNACLSSINIAPAVIPTASSSPQDSSTSPLIQGPAQHLAVYALRQQE
jgi:hypothetical protein